MYARHSEGSQLERRAAGGGQASALRLTRSTSRSQKANDGVLALSAPSSSVILEPLDLGGF
ncbi:hypothetical protein AKJ09_10883 [Labilithrix luteola]|uniref:Uncharacterized protein n=1 Tax=Labilithrix luteola TaxID=1391654 RepID=A0A0K1QFN3_9BACT|nr:hypothetical protein AKJ09_10883 [Labilithrix luteola]